MVFGRWADCESATQQIASLRYGGSAKMCPTLQGYDTHHPLVYKDCWSLDTRFWKLDCPALSTSHHLLLQLKPSLLTPPHLPDMPERAGLFAQSSIHIPKARTQGKPLGLIPTFHR